MAGDFHMRRSKATLLAGGLVGGGKFFREKLLAVFVVRRTKCALFETVPRVRD
jgi:hypothetical protein